MFSPPCPCGYYNHPEKECICPPGTVQKYLSKISGPLLDRIDLHVEVTPVNFTELSSDRLAEKSEHIRDRVIKARELQIERFGSKPDLHANAQMSPQMVRDICKIKPGRPNAFKESHGETGPLRPCVRPHTESIAHDCRPCRERRNTAGAPR